MRNKKLTLVSANKHTVPYPVYPLGISCLSSYISQEMPDLHVTVFDFMISSNEDYINHLIENKPDYIGISLRNIDDVNIFKKESFIDHYRNIIDTTRQYSKCIIITGGAGFSIYPEILFELLQPDFGIYGEGELSLASLLRALDDKQDLRSIAGLLYRENGQTIVNKRDSYFQNPVLEFDNKLTEFYWQHSGMLNIQTKRGCPYKCIYCTYPIIEGRKIRTLDPDQVVRTLADLYHTRNIDYVFFTDSIFNISNKYNLELADKLIAANLKISWGGYFNFKDLDIKLLEKLKEAGLKHIEFGTESLSDTILKKYNKPFKVADIFRICDICNDLEIDFAHFLILGGYGETNHTLDETFENSKRINRSVFFPFIGMRIYPGTALHKIAIREKVVHRDDQLLEPIYYISKDVDLATIKQKTINSGQRWILPDEDLSEVMARLRNKNKKGPLWEYLIK